MMYLTNSERSTFRKCPRRWYYEYECGRISKNNIEALYFGSAIGRGLDAIWEGEEDFITPFSTYLAEYAPEHRYQLLYHKGVAMLRGYIHQYSNFSDMFELVASEHTVSYQLEDWLTFRGQLDKVVRRKYDGRLCIIDHKTSSEDIEDPTHDYWETINYIDPQTAGYKAALEIEFNEPVDIYYDVLKKDRSLGPKLKKQIRKRKDELDEEFKARKEAEMESWDEYGSRLVEKYTSDPELYQFKQVVKTKEDLKEWRDEFIADANAIKAAREVNVYSKVTYSCGRGEHRCPYVTVCGRVNSIDSEDFTDKPCRHPELND